jgi:hypothetical protein
VRGEAKLLELENAKVSTFFTNLHSLLLLSFLITFFTIGFAMAPSL